MNVESERKVIPVVGVTVTSQPHGHIYKMDTCVYRAARETALTNILNVRANTSVSVYITREWKEMCTTELWR